MIHTAWRIVRPEHVEQALSGEGARLYGGRWNSEGTPMVYTAGSLSLAAMELLVHLEQPHILDRYVAVGITFAPACVQALDPRALPTDWDAYPAPAFTKQLGDDWIANEASLVLEVPSVVIPAERNYLINPVHPDIEKLVPGPPQPFRFDPRILQRP